MCHYDLNFTANNENTKIILFATRTWNQYCLITCHFKVNSQHNNFQIVGVLRWKKALNWVNSDSKFESSDGKLWVRYKSWSQTHKKMSNGKRPYLLNLDITRLNGPHGGKDTANRYSPHRKESVNFLQAAAVSPHQTLTFFYCCWPRWSIINFLLLRQRKKKKKGDQRGKWSMRPWQNNKEEESNPWRLLWIWLNSFTPTTIGSDWRICNLCMWSYNNIMILFLQYILGRVIIWKLQT